MSLTFNYNTYVLLNLKSYIIINSRLNYYIRQIIIRKETLLLINS